VIFAHVPGGATIRTPFRSQLASLLLVCLALAHIGTRARLAARAARRPAARLAVGALFLACLAEQASTGAITRPDREVTAWLDQAAPPPFACRVFYVLPQRGAAPRWFEQQSDAIMLSQRLAMPTMNGNSSWWPEGWHLDDPAAPGYAARVRDWATAHGLAGEACGVEPRAGRWVPGLPP
jgi:hypothetical protein